MAPPPPRSAHVDTPSAAQRLGEEIMTPRLVPLVVVSTEQRTGELLFDLDLLMDELDGVADVVTIETGAVSHELQRSLPERAQVFGGAARSYPPDFGADPSPYRSPLRFPGRSDTRQLIDDALAQVGRRSVESAPAPRKRMASGTVRGFLADGARAIVDLDGGGVATATGELLPPAIPLDWALVVDGSVTGELDGSGTELHPSPAPRDLAAAFPDGAVTLAVITKVTDRRATALLHPEEAVVLRRRDVAGEDVAVDTVLSVGDIVRVSVRRDRDGSLELSLAEDDGAPLTAPLALVTGGPPWLAPDRPLPGLAPAAHVAPAGSASQTAAQHPAPAPPQDSASIAAFTGEIAQLRNQIFALHTMVSRLIDGARGGADVERLRRRVADLEQQLREERSAHGDTRQKLAQAEETRRDTDQALREARKSSGRSDSSPSRRRADWPTDEEHVRHEIYLAWVERIHASERTVWPLRDYAVGPEFAASLETLDEAQFAKAMRACVDAVTGRIKDVAGRDLHRLRTGDGGDDPYRMRQSDHAVCWRAAIEQNVASARRLHYWELPGGGIELSRIVQHDDTRP